MQLTYLEFYTGYVKKGKINTNDGLAEVGCQCDSKDFTTESFIKNSGLNRAQQSSKMKHASLRCITWSSLCGLVWATTPLTMARMTENALVQWYGWFDQPEDQYVQIRRSDWDDLGVDDEVDDCEIEVDGNEVDGERISNDDSDLDEE